MAVKISGFALLGYLLINMLLAVCQTIWTFSTTGQPLKERGHAFGGFYGESPRWLWCEKNKWWVENIIFLPWKLTWNLKNDGFQDRNLLFQKTSHFQVLCITATTPPGENWKLTETNTEKSPARKNSWDPSPHRFGQFVGLVGWLASSLGTSPMLGI